MENKNIYLIVFVLILLLGLNFLISSPLKSLPSPIYGGDFYYQMGSVNHVKNGGSPFENPAIANALPVYFPVYSLIVSFMGSTAFSGMLFFSWIIIIASVVMLFFSFNNKWHSIIAILLFFNITQLPIIKYTDFTRYALIPVFFWLVYSFFKNKSWLNAIALGLVLGVISLSHSLAFIGCSIFLAVFFVYDIFKKYPAIITTRDNNGTETIQTKKNDVYNYFRFRALKMYLLIAAIGILIAMLYWYAPIFIHHGQTSLHYNEFNNQNWDSLAVKTTFVIDTFKEYFAFGWFASIKGIVLSALFIFGFICVFFSKQKTKEHEFLKVALLAGTVVLFHYWITQPLLHMNFMSNYQDYFIFSIVAIYVAVFGLSFIPQKVKKIVLCAVIGLLLVNCYVEYRQKMTSQWEAAGMNPMPEPYNALAFYLNENNSSVNDVILTTKEIGFAVNALSGRKLVISRRAFNDPFMQVDQRELDTAIMLYGNNSEKRVELLNKYNVSYLYWDYYWIQSEYMFDQSGQLQGWYDPIVMFANQTYIDELNRYNISYTIQHTYVDPALRGWEYKMFDLIFVTPNNYRSQVQPWDADLNNRLVPVWGYNMNNQTVAVLYKVQK